MQLTKLGHSCVTLEKNGARLVIDPGVFTDAPGALAGATAVLVTHEHPDHLDATAVRAALSGHPELTLWANQSVTDQFAEFGSRVRAVQHGDALDVAGFDVHVYGEQHALIHQDIPRIRNTGFRIDGSVFHPGDALTVPEDPVSTLLLPISAPWMKASEMIDYFRTVGAPRGIGIHDAIMSAAGLGIVSNLLKVAAAPGHADLTRLEPGTAMDL